MLEWSAQDLVASWTLVGNKTGATRLGFAVLLKFFEIAARFPSVAGEVPPSAVAYLAEHLHAPPRTHFSSTASTSPSRTAPRGRRHAHRARTGVLPAEVAGDPAPSGTHPRHDQLPGDP